MDFEFCINQMINHAAAIQSLAAGVAAEQARWKPDPASWSILEVINHLYDEERLDFRVRLDIILRRSAEDWPPIDPPRWVVERAYNKRDLADSVANFLSEREKSLAWLRGLSSPDWQTTCTTPWGQISAGDMFSAWVAHDILHLRQLVELHWAHEVEAAKPFEGGYAGEW